LSSSESDIIITILTRICYIQYPTHFWNLCNKRTYT